MDPEERISGVRRRRTTYDLETENGQKRQYCEDPLAYGDHLFRIHSLETHSHDCTATKNGAGESVIIDLYKEKKKLKKGDFTKSASLVDDVEDNMEF